MTVLHYIYLVIAYIYFSVLIVSILILLSFNIANEISIIKYYGRFIDKENKKFLINLDIEKLRLNTFDANIILIDVNEHELLSFSYIGIHNSLFSKYHFRHNGKCSRILRFSKLHYKIEEYYKILNK